MKSSVKIYFYSPDLPYKWHDGSNGLFVNPTPLYLDGHIKEAAPHLHNKIQWCKIQLIQKSQFEIITEIQELGVNMLCLSSYVWNHDHVMSISKGIKKHLPDVTVVVGGPNIDVFRNQEFLNQYPDVDYAVYSQGEEPFVEILEYELNQRPIDRLRACNLSWRGPQGIRVADHRFFKKSSGSYYLDGRHLLEMIVNDPDYEDYTFNFPYETSRGCMYGCSFCDWSSGLSHKVSKRKFAYRQEFELFGELGILNMFMSDANIGQWDYDVEIAEIMAELKQTHGYDFKVVGWNATKTIKKNAFKMLDILMSSNIITTPKVSIQDIHEDILLQNERPDIPWNEHLTYILDLQSRHPGYPIAIEMMVGLVGQTRQSMRNMLREVSRHKFELYLYPWVLLPNSPAGHDEEFRSKSKLQTQRIKCTYFLDQPAEAVVSTNSYDRSDYAWFLLLCAVYHLLNTELKQNYLSMAPEEIESAIDAVIDSDEFLAIHQQAVKNLNDGSDVFNAAKILSLLESKI